MYAIEESNLKHILKVHIKLEPPQLIPSALLCYLLTPTYMYARTEYVWRKVHDLKLQLAKDPPVSPIKPLPQTARFSILSDTAPLCYSRHNQSQSKLPKVYIMIVLCCFPTAT